MTLRSALCALHTIPATRIVGSTHAFSIYAPAIWNSLQTGSHFCHSVVSFEKRLQIYLFHTAYDI